jgi:hypothetical protein
MDYAALATELAEPQYAPYLPDDTPAICALLNALSTTMVKEKFVTARSVLASLGAPGAVTLTRLEEFAATPMPSDPPVAAMHCSVKWAMRFLAGETGIDVGHATTRGLLDALVTATVITQAEADAIKALAVQPASRAEVLFGAGARVTDSDIRAAQGV